MSEHHFEQEEVDRLKDWWKRHGSWVSAVFALTMIAIAGWRAWGWYEDKQSREAAEIYDRVVIAASKADLQALKQESGSLFEQYPKTAYAPLAALLSAKQHALGGDLKTATTLLQWVVEKSKDAGLVAVARLRLAAVLLEDAKAAEALAVLDAMKSDKGAESFDLSRLDRRGDVLLALGRKEEALKAWEEALDKSVDEPSWKQLLQIKRDYTASSLGKSS
jgi:predicted negative regulator of RcsB-dependent stress response